MEPVPRSRPPAGCESLDVAVASLPGHGDELHARAGQPLASRGVHPNAGRLSLGRRLSPGGPASVARCARARYWRPSRSVGPHLAELGRADTAPAGGAEPRSCLRLRGRIEPGSRAPALATRRDATAHAHAPPRTPAHAVGATRRAGARVGLHRQHAPDLFRFTGRRTRSAACGGAGRRMGRRRPAPLRRGPERPRGLRPAVRALRAVPPGSSEDDRSPARPRP